MPFSLMKEQGRQILRLEGPVTIRDSRELASTLMEELEAGLAAEVDCSGLEDIDTCILQLLCSLRKTVPELTFCSPGEVLIHAVDRCGLRRELLGTGEDL